MSNSVFDPVADARRRLGVPALEAQLLFWLTSIVFFTVMVANQTHIETDEAVKLAPRLEMLARLGGTALAGLIGIYGFLFVGRVQKAMFSFPGAWATGIAACFVVATVFSEHKSVAVPHLITFTCILLFAPTAFAVLGTRRFFEIALLAFTTTLVASWFLYLFMPEYGVALEVTDAASGEGVQRLGGTSHPNNLAGVSGFVVILVGYLFFSKRISWKLALPFLVLCLVTYAFTQTRVASVAAVLALLFVYRKFWFRRDVFPVTLLVFALGIAALALMLADTSRGLLSGTSLESLTRSGDVEEITSFTGRKEIWSFVVEKIGESPIVGYGPGVAKVLLEDQEMLLHPHNVVLAMALTGGVLCGFFALMMFLQQLWISWRGTFKLAALITIFVFLNSLTESFVFDYIPGPSTILWLAALYWPILDDGSL